MTKEFGTPGPPPAPPEKMADLELVRFISNEKKKKYIFELERLVLKFYLRVEVITDEESYCPSNTQTFSDSFENFIFSFNYISNRTC